MRRWNEFRIPAIRITGLPLTAMLAAVLLPCGACQRRPLSQVDNNVTVNIEIEKHIVNYTVSRDPSMMRVMFFDSESGAFATHAFLPADGGRVSVTPGRTYHIIAYNFDTEYTIVGSEYLWNGIYATTNEVPESVKTRLKTRADKNADEIIVYEPDHHFVATKTNVYIPARSVDAPPVVIDLLAETIVETWHLHIDKVQGMEYVADVSGVLSGMALSKTLADREKSEAEASIFLESLEYRTDGSVDIVFNTFGHNPGLIQEITLVITDIGGASHEFDFDISDRFDNNPDQYILIETPDIVIDEPDSVTDSGGGIAPDVDEWEDVDIGIEI